jgi:hypothetical protein
MLLGAFVQCYAETFDVDTIDNWQIYNGTELVLAGHDSPIGTVFHGTIKKSALKDLTIQFSHDVRYIDEFEITVSIADRQQKNILTKKFRTNSGIKLTIEKKELGLLTTDWIIIRYQEERKNGTDKILGEIKLE